MATSARRSELAELALPEHDRSWVLTTHTLREGSGWPGWELNENAKLADDGHRFRASGGHRPVTVKANPGTLRRRLQAGDPLLKEGMLYGPFLGTGREHCLSF